MFDRTDYLARRLQLKQAISSGLVLFIGAIDIPISSPYNSYPFRQDSSFAYFFGLQRPALAAIIDLDTGEDILFGDEQSASDMLWHGPHAHTLAAEADAVGVPTVRARGELSTVIASASQQGRAIHYLPLYRAETLAEMAQLLHATPAAAAAGASEVLVNAIVRIREIKSDAEIAELEKALAVAHDMHLTAMRHARPGLHEYEVVAEMERVLRSNNTYAPYVPIFSRRGDVLHNHSYDNLLHDGDLIVNDSGAASPLHYAADITRTIPVGGRFSERQRAIYQIVLEAQEYGIAAIRPGVAYADIHRAVALQMVRGLSALGLFHGAAEEIVDSGAYAICYPHGLGHQLGLDVHDMESYGEDLVGYDARHRRSPLFGLRSLRLGKPLRAGMVLTVEPGVYFIAQLISNWKEQGLHREYIDYDCFQNHLGFGGIRIEDNVLVTATGARVLGQPIPKAWRDIEAIMSA